MTTLMMSYMNWAFDADASVSVSIGAFETSAPAANMLTPRAAQLAVATTTGTQRFSVSLVGGSPTYGKPVKVIGLINHNILTMPYADPPWLNITVYDKYGIGWTFGADDAIGILGISNEYGINNSYFWIIPDGVLRDALGHVFDKSQVNSVVFTVHSNVTCGTKDSYTGEVNVEPFKCGCVWIGSGFAPTNGISIDGFAQASVDNSQVVRSIGGQVWAEPETRQRTMKITFAGLFESEVYALPPTPSLQQLSAFCGISRPLVVIPTTSSNSLVFMQAIYGYLSGAANWNLTEKVEKDGSKTRLYSGGLEIIEAR